ncbi:hypothetical protein HBI20_205160 [Parastagonospora nodorum]|nr:hypothetical protein HBI20_205160 [Parastagonospora nodorum]
MISSNTRFIGRTAGEWNWRLRNCLARKEFKVTKLVKADYELELHNLSLLKTLKHPNLLKLLGAYTYRHKHNLLFPLASQGTLAMLFEEERPPHYQHDAAFLRSLAGLSSALRAVHDFTANSLDLQAIGCHHDLKPSNILIDQDTFILADFGISRFKEVEQGSATPFRQGSGDYLAPECHELEGDMTKLAITRAADRWSFGAIILELTVYMAFGTNGVKAFREERKFFVEGDGTSKTDRTWV